MEDDVDVDIEGDEFQSNVSKIDEGCLAQEQFIQSAWKSSAGILPWELDSSISPENRQVIERMLLEEQYYLTGEKVNNHIWESNLSSKPKAKRSPGKTSAAAYGASSRWTKQEKELFEKGLAQFGRRWTKIAKLVGSRSVLQVKSYARQYFKHKAKAEPSVAAPSAGPVELQHAQPASSTLANTVRIEKLSDDEEVDITDDLCADGDGAHKPPMGDVCESKGLEWARMQTENPQEDKNNISLSVSLDHLSHTYSKETFEREQVSSNTHLQTAALTTSEVVTQEDECHSFQSESSQQPGRLEEVGSDGTDFPDKTDPAGISTDDEEEEEEEELKVPEQEIEMDTETITEDEKQAIPEFFEGRPAKTPERYLKIRNYILDQWFKSKPKYLNKTSVRPGLKNCGDVNCIGRIHTYLELIGAINFNCEQAVYNRPKVVDRSKHKEGKDILEAYQLAQRLQSMRTRKRRVRDLWGNWCDAKELEGQTYEHLSAEELARRREERKKHSKPCKISRFRGSLDPFQLIPCRSFGEGVQEPFQIVVCAETLLILDMHAHVSRSEVIGLLGGIYDKEKKLLKISAAEPCNSVSTGLQCEMDPVSQTQACDVLSSLGLGVVGWYHSHPTFHPNPSVRDINTQDQFQSYFSRGGAPFIGMIVSPYDPANPSPHSQTTCLLVKESQEPPGSQKLPYRFDFKSSPDTPDWEQTMRRAQWIIHKYCQSAAIFVQYSHVQAGLQSCLTQLPKSVPMNRFFRKDSHLTCLEKMLSSLARYLEPLPDEEGDAFLTQIQTLFQTEFIAKQLVPDRKKEESANISSQAVNSDSLTYNNQTHQNYEAKSDSDHEATHKPSETNSTTVLHMGSVLSAEHDYLL